MNEKLLYGIYQCHKLTCCGFALMRISSTPKSYGVLIGFNPPVPVCSIIERGTNIKKQQVIENHPSNTHTEMRNIRSKSTLSEVDALLFLNLFDVVGSVPSAAVTPWIVEKRPQEPLLPAGDKLTIARAHLSKELHGASCLWMCAGWGIEGGRRKEFEEPARLSKVSLNSICKTEKIGPLCGYRSDEGHSEILSCTHYRHGGRFLVGEPNWR